MAGALWRMHTGESRPTRVERAEQFAGFHTASEKSRLPRGSPPPNPGRLDSHIRRRRLPDGKLRPQSLGTDRISSTTVSVGFAVCRQRLFVASP
jgi:hypothetical protein